MNIKDIAMLRAKQLFEHKNSPFDSFKEAFDVALEEIIDECKFLMRSEDEDADYES